MNKEKSVSHERANDNEPILNDAQIEQIEQYYKHKFPESTQRPKFEEVARTLSNTESMKDFLECEMDVLLNLVDQNDVSGGVTLADDDHLDGDTFVSVYPGIGDRVPPTERHPERRASDTFPEHA